MYPNASSGLIRAIGDAGIYVAIGLFLLAWIGFAVAGTRSYEAARLFFAGIVTTAIIMLVLAIAT